MSLKKRIDDIIEQQIRTALESYISMVQTQAQSSCNTIAQITEYDSVNNVFTVLMPDGSTQDVYAQCTKPLAVGGTVILSGDFIIG